MSSSHYQSYLKAISGQDKGRSVSSPSPSAIARKPANRSISPSTSISSPIPLHTNGPQTPSTQPRSVSGTPASTAPSSAVGFPPPPSTPLTSHPPDTSVLPSKNTNLKPLTPDQISSAVSSALTLQSVASTQHEKRPFAALLLAPDNTTTLLSHFSISHIRHAESELARLASDHFSSAYLASCTLVSTWEPCAMCAGTVYWSGIGRVLYAASESKLKDLTGDDNDENLTMSLPCRAVLGAGQRVVDVIGPVSEWEARVVEESSVWWKQHGGKDTLSKAPSIRSNGTGNASRESTYTPTVWTHEDSVLSSIGEDGEYKADLDIDWMR